MGRKIVLYGTGFNGEKFYWGNLDRYEIAYCIDRNCNRTFHGLQVYSLEEKIDELNKCFVIIAAQHTTYMQIAAKLIQSGLTAGTDFAWAQNIGKELMILYGNCHILALFDYLTKNIFLHKRYHFLLWRLDLSKTQPWPDSVFENCRVLICQDIRKENNLLVPAASEIENKVNNCIKIRLPNLFGFFAIFPQSISERYPQSQERDSFQNISQGGAFITHL